MVPLAGSIFNGALHIGRVYGLSRKPTCDCCLYEKLFGMRFVEVVMICPPDWAHKS